MSRSPRRATRPNAPRRRGSGSCRPSEASVAGSPARRLVLVATSIAALAAPAASSASGGRERDPFALTPRVAHLAQVIVPTAVRSRPDAGRRRQGLGTEARWGGGPVRLLVLRSKLDRRGRRWLRVRLPER